MSVIDAREGALEIRLGREEEFAAIGALTVAAYERLRDDAPMGDYETQLRDVASRAEDSVVLVAVQGGALLGSVTYVPDAGCAMSEFDDPEGAGIRMLAVDPDLQGRGAGRALTEACIARARSEGRRRVFLHSTGPMLVARGMYERMGFVRRPELDEFYGGPPYSEEQPLHLIAYSLEL